MRLSIEQRINEVPHEVNELKDKIFDDHERQRQEFVAFESSCARRLKELEQKLSLAKESNNALQTLTLDFENYVNKENTREEYIRRLEAMVADMEKRVWPWRPNMDRSASPPPREERMATWQPANADGSARPDWMPWATYGKTMSPTASTVAPSPPISARPTPPTSRPSSARVTGRNRDSSYGNNSAVRRSSNPSAQPASSGSGFAAARVRPSSASSARSVRSAR
jgi:hypothetical protein